MLSGIGDTYIESMLLRRVANRSMKRPDLLAIVWLRHHSVGTGFNILERRSARLLNLPGICLTFRVIPRWWHHNRRFQTYTRLENESPPCFMIYDTNDALLVTIMTVVLWITWCALSRAMEIAIISRTLIWSWDWTFVQTPWNNSPSGSRRALQPETLASVKRVCVSWAGLRGTPWMNQSMWVHHFRWCLTWCEIKILWVSGRTWGFHCVNKAIWSGCKCNLPSTSNWAVAFSHPRRDRKTLAETNDCFRNQFRNSRTLWTLSRGILPMFSTLKNSIPMNTNVWAGINSDFSRLILSPSDVINQRVNCLSLRRVRRLFLTNQSSRYGNSVIALFHKWMAIAVINKLSSKDI